MLLLQDGDLARIVLALDSNVVQSTRLSRLVSEIHLTAPPVMPEMKRSRKRL